jgi:hypothetical protein
MTVKKNKKNTKKSEKILSLIPKKMNEFNVNYLCLLKIG